MYNTSIELLFHSEKCVGCGFVQLIFTSLYTRVPCTYNPGPICMPKTVHTFMVCFSPEQESVTSTQYGRFDDSQTSLLKVPLMCLQDFPGNALVSPTADSNLIGRERVVDSALSIAFLNQYRLSIECMTCCMEKNWM